MTRRRLLVLALVGYVVAGLALTLASRSVQDAIGPSRVLDAAINLGMFVPPVVVTLVVNRRWPPWTVVLVAAGVSATIEAAQKFVVVERDASYLDLFLNTLGAALAATAVTVVRRRRVSQPGP